MNYNRMADEHSEAACDYARCYEDIYLTSHLDTGISFFAVVFLLLYIICFLSAYMCSRCHLLYVSSPPRTYKRALGRMPAVLVMTVSTEVVPRRLRIFTWQGTLLNS